MTREANSGGLPAPPRGPIWLRSWADGISALQRMPAVALTTLALWLVAGTACNWFIAKTASVSSTTCATDWWMQQGIGWTGTFVQILLLTPLLIAVHRYVLLREVARRYSFRPVGRYLPFAAYASLIAIIFAIFTSPLTVAIFATDGINIWWAMVFQIMGVVAGLCGCHRMPILFPAIAIEVPGASIGTAMRQCSGHRCRLVCTLILVSSPMLLMTILAAMLMGLAVEHQVIGEPTGLLTKAAIWDALSGTTALLFGAIYAAMASRFYQVFTTPRLLRNET